MSVTFEPFNTFGLLFFSLVSPPNYSMEQCALLTGTRGPFNWDTVLAMKGQGEVCWVF